jgi:hypothetical protein
MALEVLEKPQAVQTRVPSHLKISRLPDAKRKFPLLS